MANLNRVFIIGNLTRNPALRYTPSGTAVTDLGMAINSTYKNKEGEKIESVCFVDVVTWGRQAETASEYLSKGSPIFVEGCLQLDSWETANGEKRSKLRIRANRIQFLGRPKGASPGQGEEAEEAPAEAPAAEAGPPEGADAGPPEGADAGSGSVDDVPF